MSDPSLSLEILRETALVRCWVGVAILPIFYAVREVGLEKVISAFWQVKSLNMYNLLKKETLLNLWSIFLFS